MEAVVPPQARMDDDMVGKYGGVGMLQGNDVCMCKKCGMLTYSYSSLRSTSSLGIWRPILNSAMEMVLLSFPIPLSCLMVLTLSVYMGVSIL